MSHVVKDGPQLTGAQALDAVIAYLRTKDPGAFDIALFVSILRAEKFADPQTENPLQVLEESKTFAL